MNQSAWSCLYRTLCFWVLASAVGAQSGCLRPLTDRLDAIHEELRSIHEQLLIANQRLEQTNGQLDDMNKRLRRFPGLGVQPEQDHYPPH
ncbi:MAG: hypothetical protein C4297_08715 [Gemmataceae bacterium]